MVRRATAEDAETIVAMGQTFVANSPYATQFAYDPERARQTVDWLIVHGAIFIAERDGVTVGMFGIIVAPHLIAAETVASDVFWWVSPAARGLGLSLLREAEAWAKTQGATAMNLVAPDERAEQLYGRLGFTLIESVYTRKLG